MSSTSTIALHHLDELVHAAKLYLDATVTKCDSPEIRFARTALIKATVVPSIELELIKKSVKVCVDVRESVV